MEGAVRSGQVAAREALAARVPVVSRNLESSNGTAVNGHAPAEFAAEGQV
jgi:hypothetical protein